MFLQVVTVIGALSSFCEAATTSIRLRGGATQWDGRVEILYQKEWGTICDVGWELVDANVSSALHEFIFACVMHCSCILGYMSAAWVLIGRGCNVYVYVQ